MNARVRKLVNEILPPVLFRAIQRLIKGGRAYVFNGEYGHIREAPTVRQGYYNKDWIEQICIATKKKKDILESVAFLPRATEDNNIKNLFPLMVSMCATKQDRKVMVFDFGGGMGVSYLDCSRIIKPSVQIDYHILDTGPICEGGRKIFNKDITFHTEIPRELKDVSIVHLGSSLQYVQDYRATLRDLIALDPEYLFIVDNFMGPMKTFATGQVNMPGKTIPYWIFNYDEIIDLIEKSGYMLVYKSANYQPVHDLTNFPEAYALQDTYNRGDLISRSN